MSSTPDTFTPVFDVITERYGLISAAVFGRVWRYTQDKDGYCWASHKRIASELHLNRATVWRHLDKLKKDGLIIDENPGQRNKTHHLRVNIDAYEKLRNVAFNNTDVSVCNIGVAESNGGIAESDKKRQGKRESNKQTIKEIEGQSPSTTTDNNIINKHHLIKNHNAVIEYRSFLQQRNAPVESLIDIAETVGTDKASLQRWKEIMREWVVKDLDRSDINAMLEEYKQEGVYVWSEVIEDSIFER